VVVCALAVSTSPAVAKPEFLHWQGWDFYTRPQKPVSVEYVWNSSYDGIHFPKKVTTVLRVKGPPDSLFWRATTLDVFDGRAWVESGSRALLPPNGDPLLPARARAGKDVIRNDVTVLALRDRHLVGASVPIGYRAPASLGDVRLLRSGTAIASRAVPRDDHYLAFSYAPQPTPDQLSDSQPVYPAALTREGYLDVEPGLAVPAFGEPNRDARIRAIFRSDPFQHNLEAYAGLWAKARQVVGQPADPYAAALALETWFRTTGGFVYTEQPGRAGPAPLADFVTRTKRGYCQHFAGAMALMLRYLGIPARVAAGFTSGRYDSEHATWTVTDHDAHMWVEAWFDGYGWLPFDPTPGRGSLSATYTVSSRNFDVAAARRMLALAAAAALGDPADYKQEHAFGERDALSGFGTSADARRAGADVPPAASPGRASLLRLLALVAAALLGAIVLAKVARRRSRFLTRDPRRVAGACRRELAEFLADQRVAVPRSATLTEVGAAVEREYPVDAQPFVEAATAARYGRADAASAAAGAARRELRALEAQIRRQLGVVERVLGVVSLRSLGFSA
jgi:transglutaminase-like putative cysteine protease